MTVAERCSFMVCREPATQLLPAVPVPLCFGHHLSPDGALYVGDLDRLLVRPRAT